MFLTTPSDLSELMCGSIVILFAACETQSKEFHVMRRLHNFHSCK